VRATRFFGLFSKSFKQLSMLKRKQRKNGHI
jgi:hypothetical protein